jgi:hypothetical protein
VPADFAEPRRAAQGRPTSRFTIRNNGRAALSKIIGVGLIELLLTAPRVNEIDAKINSLSDAILKQPQEIARK